MKVRVIVFVFLESFLRENVIEVENVKVLLR